MDDRGAQEESGGAQGESGGGALAPPLDPGPGYEHCQTGRGGSVATIYSDILNVTQKTGYRVNIRNTYASCFTVRYAKESCPLLWLQTARAIGVTRRCTKC